MNELTVTKEQLEEHGLKEIKFSELTDGEEFNIPNDFCPPRQNPPEFYRRKLVGSSIVYADGMPMFLPEDVTLYVDEGDDIVFVKV